MCFYLGLVNITAGSGLTEQLTTGFAEAQGLTKKQQVVYVRLLLSEKAKRAEEQYDMLRDEAAGCSQCPAVRCCSDGRICTDDCWQMIIFSICGLWMRLSMHCRVPTPVGPCWIFRTRCRSVRAGRFFWHWFVCFFLLYNDFNAAYGIEEKISQQFPEQTPRYDE